MAKRLRLAAAQLTDVGRKRERNQDNVSHYIPTDESVLEQKGALFVVCDGMGGHAAGEVASEMGVAALQEMYYSTSGDDIISSLAQAVDAANQSIYAHARENPELTGMGTTCVALVVSGGRAYFVNIGDSRGYIVRDGELRQVTRDHSWVAEQVRVGLLTEEQARTHSHRNVITRSLGTQPTVTADLFVESLRDGDRVLLCSDGLHGYVEEEDIKHELEQDVPLDTSVHHLIDMANANGGPDNITALVVHLLEVPEVTGELALPQTAQSELNGTTQPLPVTEPATARTAAATAVATREAPAAWQTRTDHQQRISPRAKRPLSLRLIIAAIQVIVALIVVVVGIGGWYIFYGPFAAAHADTASAQAVIQQAQTQDPATALHQLAQTRTRLVNDTNNALLDPQSRQQIQGLLSGQFEAAVQHALQRYDAAALVTPINASDVQTYSLRCPSATGASAATLTDVKALATVAIPLSAPGGTPAVGQQLSYLLSAGQIYQMLVPLASGGAPTTGAAVCTPLPIADTATVVALASDGAALYALAEQGSGTYLVQQVIPDGYNPDGTPRTRVGLRFSVPTSGGQTPTLIAAQGGTISIGYTGGTSVAGVWLFTGDPTRGPAHTALLTQSVVSLAATTNVLYALLADGSLGQIDLNALYAALPVNVPAPVQPANPSRYSVSAPVPTPEVAAATSTATVTPAPVATATATTAPTVAPAPTATRAAAAPAAGTPVATTPPPPTPTAAPVTATLGAPSGTLFLNGSGLAVDPAIPTHLLIGDSQHHRVVRLVASTSGPGLGLSAQYVVEGALPQISPLAVTSYGGRLYIYSWNGTNLSVFSVPVA